MPLVLLFLLAVAIAVIVDLALAWVFANWLLDTVPYLSAFDTFDWFRVIIALGLLFAFSLGAGSWKKS